MHGILIILALGIAVNIRLVYPRLTTHIERRWQVSLFFFLFPPLLLLTTAVAVICMGYKGEMFGLQASIFSYALAVIFAVLTVFTGVKLFARGLHTQESLSLYPQKIINGKLARIIDTNFPYSALIGTIGPELVVTQGLIDSLDEEHLEAVLAHEQAHYDYGDTFWFFWLGWIKSVTSWLPYTDDLWRELLFLRETRADKKASQTVDSLLLAESLLIVASQITTDANPKLADDFCAAFDNLPQNRLLERVDRLLSPTHDVYHFYWQAWLLLSLSLIPFILLPWHS
ncbi:MAG: Protease HtpX [Chroococcopsis gigantea SAG 12.99]|jgi:Zn-dependent protease with chaperone function|nr:M56 family metallopeptidase [Chlorogloea purpurea SAG 13.99]MDV3002341.1 Protease HtpX [Chroococcopsis gigantea SAG 12.99]